MADKRSKALLEMLRQSVNASDESEKGGSESFDQLLRKLVESKTDDTDWEDSELIKQRVGELRAKYDLLMTRYNFQPGQFVKWKQGLKNRRKPEYGEPSIIIEVLDEPVLSSDEESGSAYFREKLSLILGILDSDGDLVVFHYDGRRFEPCEVTKLPLLPSQ